MKLLITGGAGVSVVIPVRDVGQATADVRYYMLDDKKDLFDGFFR